MSSKNYYRNVDDVVSDPEVLAARYRIGRSVFFEVALVLAEQADNIKASSSSTSGGATSSVGGIIGGGDDGGGDGGGGGGGGGEPCPREDMYVLIGEPGQEPKAIQAGYVYDHRDDGWRFYNPLSRSYNLATKIERVPNTEMMWHETELGAGAVTSKSHKIIRNTGDRDGTRLSTLKVRGELLSCFYESQGKDKVWRTYQDQLLEVKDMQAGAVIKVSLEAEFIYCVGETPDRMTLAHNRKFFFVD